MLFAPSPGVFLCFSGLLLPSPDLLLRLFRGFATFFQSYPGLRSTFPCSVLFGTVSISNITTHPCFILFSVVILPEEHLLETSMSRLLTTELRHNT